MYSKYARAMLRSSLHLRRHSIQLRPSATAQLYTVEEVQSDGNAKLQNPLPSKPPSPKRPPKCSTRCLRTNSKR